MKSLVSTTFALFLSAQAHLAFAQESSGPPQFPTEPAAVSESYLARAQDVALGAMNYLGIPYRWGGSTPESGFDCAGLVQYVFKQTLGMVLPRTSFDMGVTGKSVSVTDLMPGDLVFFNTMRAPFSHVGIYIGENRFIHAPRRGKNVEIVDMNGSYWQQRYNGARRLAQ